MKQKNNKIINYSMKKMVLFLELNFENYCPEKLKYKKELSTEEKFELLLKYYSNPVLKDNAKDGKNFVSFFETIFIFLEKHKNKKNNTQLIDDLISVYLNQLLKNEFVSGKRSITGYNSRVNYMEYQDEYVISVRDRIFDTIISSAKLINSKKNLELFEHLIDNLKKETSSFYGIDIDDLLNLKSKKTQNFKLFFDNCKQNAEKAALLLSVSENKTTINEKTKNNKNLRF